MRAGTNLGKGGRNEEGEQWSESNSILEVELRELVDEVQMGCERKRGIKDNSWLLA